MGRQVIAEVNVGVKSSARAMKAPTCPKKKNNVSQSRGTSPANQAATRPRDRAFHVPHHARRSRTGWVACKPWDLYCRGMNQTSRLLVCRKQHVPPIAYRWITFARAGIFASYRGLTQRIELHQFALGEYCSVRLVKPYLTHDVEELVALPCLGRAATAHRKKLATLYWNVHGTR